MCNCTWVPVWKACHIFLILQFHIFLTKIYNFWFSVVEFKIGKLKKEKITYKFEIKYGKMKFRSFCRKRGVDGIRQVFYTGDVVMEQVFMNGIAYEIRDVLLLLRHNLQFYSLCYPQCTCSGLTRQIILCFVWSVDLIRNWWECYHFVMNFNWSYEMIATGSPHIPVRYSPLLPSKLGIDLISSSS